MPFVSFVSFRPLSITAMASRSSDLR